MDKHSDTRGFWPGLLALLKAAFTPGSNSPRHVLVVELEKPIPVTHKDDEAAIATLKFNPGFIALMNRLRLKRAYLIATLEKIPFKDIRDVDSAQHCLHWLRFLESEVDNATGNIKTKETPRLAVNEVEEFEKIRHAIESVGVGPTSLEK